MQPSKQAFTSLVSVFLSFALFPFSGEQALAVPQGGTMNLNLDAEPTTLNPVSSTDLYASQVQGYVMESLCEVNEDTYEIEPGLAEKCESSKDGKTFTFVLRQGLKWHDGQPLTMEDVKFSYDVIFDNKFPTAHKRPYLEAIEKYEVLDPRTIRFTAKTKYFRNYDSIAALLTIVPKHLYSDPSKKGLGKELVGSGPYKLAEYEKGKRIVLEKNKEWWGFTDPRFKDKRNNVDKIVFRFVKEDSIQIEMLKKGDLDYIPMSPEVFEKKAVGEEFGKTILKVKTENKSPKSYGFVGWNLNNDMFKDKNVRIALAHLVNRKLMIEKFRYGMSLPATGPWYQQSEYANPNVKAIPFDVKKATELLKKAGWADSDKNGILDRLVGGEKREFRFQLIYGNQDTEKYWTMYKEDAKQAGIEIELKLVEWNTMVKLMDEGKFDAIALGWGAGSVAVDPKQVWHSSSATKGGSNFVGYKNPEVDKLIDKARETFDKKARIKILQDVYKKIADDAPYAFLFNDKNVLYGHRSRIKKAKDTMVYSVGTAYWWIE